MNTSPSENEKEAKDTLDDGLLHDGKMVPENGISTGPESQAREGPSKTTPRFPPAVLNLNASPPDHHRNTAAAATVPLPQLMVSASTPFSKVRIAYRPSRSVSVATMFTLTPLGAKSSW